MPAFPCPTIYSQANFGSPFSLFFPTSSCGNEVTSQIFGQRRSEADSWHLISALDLAGASGVELEGGGSCRYREEGRGGFKDILILV